jgi:mono/diheme cytochrome c family protein
VDVPDVVRRQAQAEGRHLRPLTAVDDGLQELLVAEPAAEEVGSAGARVRVAARVAAVLSLLCIAASATFADDAPQEALTNPFLGDAEAIADGRRIYRMRCVICHAWKRI